MGACTYIECELYLFFNVLPKLGQLTDMTSFRLCLAVKTLKHIYFAAVKTFSNSSFYNNNNNNIG